MKLVEFIGESKLPGALSGFSKVILALAVGFVISEVVRALFWDAAYGQLIIVVFNLLNIVGGILALSSQKYWSITYLLGYLGGLYFLGRYFVSQWEFVLYMAVGGFLVFNKIKRKF